MSYQAPATLAASLFCRMARAPMDGPALRWGLRIAAVVPLAMGVLALAVLVVPLQP
ncbi:hypothetical protein GCM10007301_40720 [Azorhizobium oxalatiphilum]|uniref:Uncharacterized protein n=1 Tax=Azorhizobium oxalatiphilum TaxID=980631 RepID=A0A917FFL6_9HYPH|nr:hypothetical protein [Azorhizobium oxalatiphilum]GGF76699.1 hypothetical protein GCM10007301_40720 [Azorhizobium oxalatiphilum]